MQLLSSAQDMRPLTAAHLRRAGMPLSAAPMRVIGCRLRSSCHQDYASPTESANTTPHASLRRLQKQFDVESRLRPTVTGAASRPDVVRHGPCLPTERPLPPGAWTRDLSSLFANTMVTEWCEVHVTAPREVVPKVQR